MITTTDIVSEEQWHALRAPLIGASEAGALVGIHEYKSYYGLWAQKTGRLPPQDFDTAAMERGRRLEQVAVDVIRDRFPDWTLEVPRKHYADSEFGLGATPDLFAFDPVRGLGTVQIKSVAPAIFRHTWHGESDAIEPPLWIVIQALLERELTGASWAAIAALVVDHGIDLHMIEVPDHPAVIDQVKREAKNFWAMVADGREPDPDYRRDGELIRQMLGKDDGSEIDLSAHNELPELLDEREAMAAMAKQYKENAEAINARLLHMLGSASIGRFKGGYISAKTIHRKGYTVEPTQFRKLQVVRKGAA